MGLLNYLVRAVSSDSTVIVYECPRCGENLDCDDSECPSCCCDRVAQYKIK